MTVNITAETALIVAGFDDTALIKQSRGFQTFFSQANPSPTFVRNAKSFNYDIKRGSKKASKLLTRDQAISLGTNQVPHTGAKFQNTSYVFPNFTETASADWNDTFDRGFEEDPYGNRTRQQRLQELLIDNANEGVSMIMSGMEKMATESITTGKITLDDAVSSQYNFGRAAANTFAASAFWTVTTHNPLTDLDSLAEAIQQNGKTSPNFAVFGKEAWVAFQNNTLIKANADIRNYHFIKLGDLASNYVLNPHVSWMQAAGFTLQGEVRTPEGRVFPIFTYLEQYQDDSLVWQDYMAPKAVFMGDSTARLDRYFGPRITLPATSNQSQDVRELLGIDIPGSINLEPNGTMGVIDANMFDFDFQNPESMGQTGIYLRTSLNPLYIPTHIDAFGLITATVA